MTCFSLVDATQHYYATLIGSLGSFYTLTQTWTTFCPFTTLATFHAQFSFFPLILVYLILELHMFSDFLFI
jgi:hypothetical protein